MLVFSEETWKINRCSHALQFFWMIAIKLRLKVEIQVSVCDIAWWIISDFRFFVFLLMLKFLISFLSQLFGIGKRKPQLILLDHGLYRELNFHMRINYAALWKVHRYFFTLPVIYLI